MYSKLDRIIILLKQNNFISVDLAGTRLNNEDVRNLSNAINESNKLQKLILGGVVFGCEIGDSEMIYLSNMLEKNVTLNYLDLRANHITDHGIEILSSSLKKNNTLRFLDLRSNKITPNGKKLFEENIISLKGNNLSVAFD